MKRKFCCIYLFFFILCAIFSEEISYTVKIVEFNNNETSLCSIHIIDLSLSEEISKLQKSLKDIPNNYKTFSTPSVFPILAGEKDAIFSTNNIEAIFFKEDSFIIYLSKDEAELFKSILEKESNSNKFITIIMNNHAIGFINTNYCSIGSNGFVFLSPTTFITDSYIKQSHLSAKAIYDTRNGIKDFIDIPFNSTIIETLKLLDEKEYNYEVYRNQITINENINYLGKTITKCTLLFNFNKLYHFEVNFDNTFEDEPSFDVYVQNYVKKFHMKQKEDYLSSLFQKFESYSGISLLLSPFTENMFTLYDENSLETACEISNNKDEPLGYCKWTTSRFRMIASENIDKDIMFENMRIYNISEDGNYITLIDYYDNFLNAIIDSDSKTPDMIDRILYLHEQRQVYHSANCFADIFGHIELDKNSNTPIFFIEMIN